MSARTWLSHFVRTAAGSDVDHRGPAAWNHVACDIDWTALFLGMFGWSLLPTQSVSAESALHDAACGEAWRNDMQRQVERLNVTEHGLESAKSAFGALQRCCSAYIFSCASAIPVHLLLPTLWHILHSTFTTACGRAPHFSFPPTWQDTQTSQASRAAPSACGTSLSRM